MLNIDKNFSCTLLISSILNDRKTLSNTHDVDFDLNLYLSKVLVIEDDSKQSRSVNDDNDDDNDSDAGEKKNERINHALVKLQESYGLIDNTSEVDDNNNNNVKRVKDLLEERFDSNGCIANNKSSTTPRKIIFALQW